MNLTFYYYARRADGGHPWYQVVKAIGQTDIGIALDFIAHPLLAGLIAQRRNLES
jgi:hypothetical protein